MSAVAILLRTANMLEPDGWCQFKARDGSKRCLMAAINDAASEASQGRGYGQVLAGQARARLARSLGIDPVLFSAQGWNDERGRKVGDVTAALRMAATQ